MSKKIIKNKKVCDLFSDSVFFVDWIIYMRSGLISWLENLYLELGWFHLSNSLIWKSGEETQATAPTEAIWTV